MLHTKGLVSKYKFSDFIGNSKIIKGIIKQAKIYAETDSTVLISGETGTGKEIIAHSIHSNSSRANQPFIAVNCAALPESLLESEMFGYEEGAFTGARRGGKAGIFELAHNGTIFLDEISEMPMHLQVRLLRVIQEREFMRIGGDNIIPVDVRIIAATNRNLKNRIQNNKFRNDLFYRLNLLNLEIPPLRHRLEDILPLTKYFVNKIQKHYNCSVTSFDKTQLNMMRNYLWPGNVRELENFIHKYIILSNKFNDSKLFTNIWKEYIVETKEYNTNDSITLKIDSLDNMINSIIHQVYESTGGNKSLTSKALKINRNTVIKRLKS
jgi:transcriptional regulator with PAS, ATPase and Fis domain